LLSPPPPAWSSSHHAGDLLLADVTFTSHNLVDTLFSIAIDTHNTP
jgi:hypothetical protein